MTRLLVVGLLACVIALLAMLAGVDAREPSGTEPADRSVPGVEPTRTSALADVGDATSPPRAPANALAETRRETTSRSAATDRPHHAVRDVGLGAVRFEGGIVEARVVDDETGAPIPGAHVELDTDARTLRVPTDSLGLARFAEVPEGIHWIRASSGGRAGDERELHVTSMEPTAQVELRLAVERELVVRLVDPSGLPFRPAEWGLDPRVFDRIALRLAAECGDAGRAFDRDAALPCVARAADGELGARWWRARTRNRGPLCAHVLLGDVILGAAPVAEGANEVDVRIDAVALAQSRSHPLVRVLDDSNGSPIAGATITFERASGAEAVQTAADGRARVPSVLGRVPDAVVSAKGYASRRLVDATAADAEHVVRLAPGRRITGRVVDGRGAPASGARVTADAHESDAETLSARTDEHGAFELRDLPRCVVQLRASRGWDQGSTNADCKDEDVHGIELVLRPIRVRHSPRR